MLYHPGDSSRGPMSTCGATSGGGLSYVTPVTILHSVVDSKSYHRGLYYVGGVLSYVGVLSAVVYGIYFLLLTLTLHIVGWGMN